MYLIQIPHGRFRARDKGSVREIGTGFLLRRNMAWIKARLDLRYISAGVAR